jgi:hypothetical protein
VLAVVVLAVVAMVVVVLALAGEHAGSCRRQALANRCDAAGPRALGHPKVQLGAGQRWGLGGDHFAKLGRPCRA